MGDTSAPLVKDAATRAVIQIKVREFIKLELSVRYRMVDTLIPEKEAESH
jgi:hypothetical protein